MFGSVESVSEDFDALESDEHGAYFEEVLDEFVSVGSAHFPFSLRIVQQVHLFVY